MKEKVDVKQWQEWVYGESNGLERLAIGEDALDQLAHFVVAKGYGRIVLISDQKIDEVTGINEAVKTQLQKQGKAVAVKLITAKQNGDVIADEAAVVEALLAITGHQADVVIAVGAGTIHDIVRYAAFASKIPFISVPTAPSVDGFTSKGAPLIIQGQKITIAAIGPTALFADINVLVAAPRAMIAAGFGDMLGKYTSLLDWKFGHLRYGEPYDQQVADKTKVALLACVLEVSAIAAGEKKAIQLLLEALLLSGFAMLQFGHSHSASGAEHHLSHSWEMAYLEATKNQLLHGAKVGVACTLISELYHKLITDEQTSALSKEDRAVLTSLVASLPTQHQLEQLLQQVGGPATVEQLGIDKSILENSLRTAHEIRPNRYTVLRIKRTGENKGISE
ncbi:sn-glycerol-1-phosphate dehydrogenase [Paenibacillus yanchengensis]|uniref:Sn-glycerol-1-phosphate dehydrogenase n=1 Tax=Paenibacillus yanchengensis TaxID=2035833 RepID=A0ABW4YNT3_9BACL